MGFLQSAEHNGGHSQEGLIHGQSPRLLVHFLPPPSHPVLTITPGARLLSTGLGASELTVDSMRGTPHLQKRQPPSWGPLLALVSSALPISVLLLSLVTPQATVAWGQRKTGEDVTLRLSGDQMRLGGARL